jgi:hypothetical protein
LLRNQSRAVCIYIGQPDLLKTVAGGDVLTITDLPQESVIDLASVLGVEPEYAMDPPTRR